MARPLVATGAGRFLLVALPLAIVAGLLWRDRLVGWFGLGLAPLGAWSGAALYMAVASPLGALKAWRRLAG
ncbi:MAG: hypothetical protein HYY34_07415, partial [Chloroflexi bacterium]|nr:hypothetical protein [Chloroflexota bacterium]